MHRFCPVCGQPLAERVLHSVARQVCTGCGRVHYRNSKPCVGAVLLRGREVLLSKRAGPPHQGQWDLPGGFLEAAEPPEEGLRRELQEETTLRLRSATLLDIGIGDYAGEPTFNLTYLCEAEGEPRAGDDSEELRWWPLDALPLMPWAHERAVLARLAKGR